MLAWLKALANFAVELVIPGHSAGAAVTAQGAKVTRSPVASGSGITQTISEIHYHQYTQPVPTRGDCEEPLPNIRYIRSELFSLEADPKLGLFQGFETPNSLILRFANEPKQGAHNLAARVKAVLIYRYGQNEVDVAGIWLGENRENSDICEFASDSRRHTLIAGTFLHEAFLCRHKRYPLLSYCLAFPA